ncbi:hypothetical protein [Bacteroides pyogenes]|uniref:hypothetical protein n=1 Tax=Bacteroides pyogenes TaxID=310300 RepID=UPI00165314EB|nr:hypothetical protein [Bacteroides pyogenes]MCF2707647.1 hypothetical protein [Bacteroides pyogenes]MCI7069412.1 hypothetical protein [Bacteroides pyogenes]MDY4248478.1 hypothetical protein [Bacteroides pyogenes]MDY5354800.1 hypothetical protein [Bacteroides pyogenes]
MSSLQNLSFVHADDEDKHEAVRQSVSALLQTDDAGAGRRGAESFLGLFSKEPKGYIFT